MTNKKLENKVIVITGGTKGVGRAAAEEFARCGARVVIGGRDVTAGLQAVRIIKTYGSDGLFVPTDLQKISNCRNLFRLAHETYGKIDGFFAYAGVTPISPLDSCSEETFDWVMNVNFKATFFCCQEAVKYMRENGGV